ncbi:lamin tail domain-containing protein, partial [bacterium]|nr:lamin tail domain-containing protein [bacterium]
MKKIIFIFVLLSFLVTAAGATTNLSIVTFNVRKFADTVGDDQYNAVAKITRYLDADIYCFQEIKGGNPEIILQLRDQYFKNYSVFLVRNYPGDKDTFNAQAIMSRYPILEAQLYSNAYYELYSIHMDFTRELLCALIDVPCADKIAIFSSHFKQGTESLEKIQREIEATMTRDIITNYCSKFPDNQIVMCGDLNTDNNYSGYGNALTILTNSSAELRLTEPSDPCSGLDITWQSGTYTRRFDYQLPNPRLAVASGAVFRTDSGCPLPDGFYTSTSSNASDHFPVWQNFILSPKFATNHARILVTEMDVWRSSSHAEDEFIELYNAGYVAENLKNWAVSDIDGDAQIITTNMAILHPGDYAVISKGNPDNSDTNSADDGILNLYIAGNLDFTSTDDQLELLNWGLPVDGVAYNNGGTIASGNANDFNSMAEFQWKYPLLQSNYASNKYNARSVRVTGPPLHVAGESLSRWRDENGIYVDSNRKVDWYVTNIFTRGADNFIKTFADYPGEILLTEVFLTETDPEKHFIELYNADCRPVDIGGFSLTNSGGIGPAFSSTNALLLPNQFGVIYFTNKTTEICAAEKGVLTIFTPEQPDADADIIALRDNSGRIINSFIYDASPGIEISWNRYLNDLTAEFENTDSNDNWIPGLPTPGAFPEAIPEAGGYLLFV